MDRQLQYSINIKQYSINIKQYSINIKQYSKGQTKTFEPVSIINKYDNQASTPYQLHYIEF